MRALSLFGALCSLGAFAAEPVTARFTVPGGERYQVLVRQGDRQLPCPAPVTADRPCELQLEQGEALIEANGSPSFEFSYEHRVSTSHELQFRRTWPKWVGLGLVIAAIGSFGLGATYQSGCNSTQISDRVHCSTAPAFYALGGVFALLGLPPFIYGFFTGNRTVSTAL